MTKKVVSEIDISKPFWKYRVTYNWDAERKFEEGVINEPINEQEARDLLIKAYGRKNNENVAKIEYLEKLQ